MALQKKYVCAFCARAFTRLEHKQRHERSHTNEKPFHCMHCSSAFVRRDLLQRHCRTVHNINLSKDRGEISPKSTEGDRSDGRSDNKDPRSELRSGSISGTTINGASLPGAGLPGPNLGNISHNVLPSTKSLITNLPALPTPLPTGRSRSIDLDSEITYSKPRANSISVINVTKSDVNQNNDTVSLLSIGKRLYQVLTQSNHDMTKFDEDEINEVFLIGYIELGNNTQYPVFKDICKRLLHYLNSNFLDLNSFKIVLVYAILSYGYNMKNNNGLSLEFFNHGWNLLTLKLMPVTYNTNNLGNQLEILNDLFVLSFIFLEFNLEKDAGNSNANLNSDVIFNYLNDISSIIMTNIQNDRDSNSSLFWCLYILLSNYFINNYPPKIYSLMLTKKTRDDQTLSQTMMSLSKSVTFIETEFLKDIITCTLSNELNHWIRFNKFLIYDLKNTLHNSIILINKSCINLNLDNRIFGIFKKKLIINCPVKFNDLLNHYIFHPLQKFEFNLLNIALKEFNHNQNYNYNFNFNLFIMNNLKTDLFKFSNNLLPFFNCPIGEINNNLGIISFPIIFNSSFLNEKFNIYKIHDLPQFFKRNLNFMMIEWYLTIFKILININRNESMMNNYIIQCLLFLLNGNSSNFEVNQKLFKKLENIYNDWLNFINHKEMMLEFNINLNQFTNNFINSNFKLENNYTTRKEPNLYQRRDLIPLPQFNSSLPYNKVVLPNPEREKELMLPPIISPLKPQIP